MISSCTGSYVTSCEARVILVDCPAILLTAPALPFANLANAAMDGKATQLNVRNSFLLVSYVIDPMFPNIGAGELTGADRIVRIGGVSPVAVRL
jgi:hypothetical protein